MLTSTKYTYTLCQVQYPEERGYRWEASPLPTSMYLTITKAGDNKYVTVYSRLHVNKEVRMPITYGAGVGDREILKDVAPRIARRFT